MRNACFDLAVLINKKCPDCREQAVAITKLEEVMMWANTAITRYPETILEEDKK
jgi:hypothetical protein